MRATSIAFAVLISMLNIGTAAAQDEDCRKLYDPLMDSNAAMAEIASEQADLSAFSASVEHPDNPTAGALSDLASAQHAQAHAQAEAAHAAANKARDAYDDCERRKLFKSSIPAPTVSPNEPAIEPVGTSDFLFRRVKGTARPVHPAALFKPYVQSAIDTFQDIESHKKSAKSREVASRWRFALAHDVAERLLSEDSLIELGLPSDLNKDGDYNYRVYLQFGTAAANELTSEINAAADDVAAQIVLWIDSGYSVPNAVREAWISTRLKDVAYYTKGN